MYENNSVNYLRWYEVDGSLFERIDGAGVFLGVGETAVAEDAGNGLDVGSVAEEVGAAAVTSAVPCDMFLDTGTGDPVMQCFQTHGVARKREDNLITVAVFGLANESQKSVVEWDVYSAGCAMGFGLALLELQKLVGVVDVGIGEIFDIAPAKTVIEAEDKGTVNVGILLVIVRGNKPPRLYPFPQCFPLNSIEIFLLTDFMLVCIPKIL